MKVLIIMSFFLISHIYAGTSALSGLVTEIKFYGNQYSPSTTHVKFKTDNMHADVDWYLIHSDEEYRKEMTSMLLTAKSTRLKVNVRWHSTSNDVEERVHILSFE